MGCYRTILLELRDEPASEPRLRLATALARRFGAELLAAHVAALPTVALGMGDIGAYADAGLIEAQREANGIVQARVRDAFERAREPDVPARGVFLEDALGTALTDLARTADLTLVGPAHADEPGAPAPPAMHGLLVEAGGPVLVLPPGVPAALPPARAVVAWNGGRQAARAAKDALPLLAAAGEVLLLTLGEPADGAGPDAAAAMLARHGVKVRAEARPEQGATGAQLLAAAGELGADLLVMGAYSHSRLREAVFGGTTHDVLRDARLPVLFST